jgi:hypothetical protein
MVDLSVAKWRVAQGNGLVTRLIHLTSGTELFNRASWRRSETGVHASMLFRKRQDQPLGVVMNWLTELKKTSGDVC